MKWRPISEAPRDGTHILGWSADFGQRETYMAKYQPGSPGYALWEKGDGLRNIGWEWDEPYANSSHKWKPTHWMPLPEPPEVCDGS
ncbi:hypothetical protein FHW84_002533 [Dyella sp. SG562]|nr:hypothetical protein [Dyella sp. SG562]